MPEKERISFEEALKRLEEIVNKLQVGETHLEESIKLFEEGTELSKYCASILEQAELKIEKVNQSK